MVPRPTPPHATRLMLHPARGFTFVPRSVAAFDGCRLAALAEAWCAYWAWSTAARRTSQGPLFLQRQNQELTKSSRVYCLRSKSKRAGFLICLQGSFFSGSGQRTHTQATGVGRTGAGKKPSRGRRGRRPRVASRGTVGSFSPPVRRSPATGVARPRAGKDTARRVTTGKSPMSEGLHGFFWAAGTGREEVREHPGRAGFLGRSPAAMVGSSFRLLQR